MKSKLFWRSAINRAVRTFAQTMIASLGTAAVLSDVNWTVSLSASALAALLSVLTSLATGLPEAVEVPDEFDTGL